MHYQGYQRTTINNPVPNIWYLAFSDLNARIENIGLAVATVTENMNVQVILDSQILTAPNDILQTNDLEYYWYRYGIRKLVGDPNYTNRIYGLPFIEGRTVQVLFRKTSNNGNGVLTCDVESSLRELI